MAIPGYGRAKKVLHIGLDGMNLPLLQRFAAEGCLPTFSALMARGSTNRLLCAIPAWTPTNWATMMTGVPAGTHGLAGWSVREKTAPWSAPRLDSWQSEAMTAETIWEVADQAGQRVLVTFYPSGVWPSRMEHGYVVAPGFHDSALPIAPPVQFYCTPRAAGEGTGDDAAGMGGRSGATTDLAEEGAPPGSSTVRLASAAEQGWRHAPAGALAARCPLPLHDGSEDALYLLVERRDDGGLGHSAIYRSPDASQLPLAELTLGEWSPFGNANWGSGAVAHAGSIRFHLLAVDHEQPAVRFLTSQVYSTQGIASPAGLSEDILEHCGPFFDTFSINPVDGEAELRAFMGDIRYQGEWEVNVARYVAKHGGWDHHYCHWHLFDHINHPTVNPADPDGPDYDPERGAWMIEAQRQTYIIGDAVLKQFLELADDETLVCVISDHAMAPAHRWAHLNARLEETGLLVLKPGGAIDFSQSQVYTQADRGSEVFVNLRGREPMGIVPPADYERVQEAIIGALLDWRDPLTDKRAVALALKLEDGQLIGFWGDICGDVVFTFNRGFGWGPPLDGGSIGQGRGALHGSQVPHAETPHFTNMGCWILAGPGVKAGYERDWQRQGLMRMTDVAPTLAHLAGLRPPAQNIGAICHDLLE